jgi:hypothetical protein
MLFVLFVFQLLSLMVAANLTVQLPSGVVVTAVTGQAVGTPNTAPIGDRKMGTDVYLLPPIMSFA